MANRFKPGRMISESILDSGDLEDLPYWADKLWLGLLLLADNSGWFRDRDSLYSGRILTKTGRHQPKPGQVRDILRTFVDRGMLSPDERENVSGYRITNFAAGQRLRDRTSARNRHGDGDGDGDGDGGGGTVRAIAAQEPEEIPPKEDPGDLEDVVDFYSTQLCLNPAEALELVRKLKVTSADLDGWREALSEAAKKKLNDYRAYVRSRARRFRTAAEAFGSQGKIDWSKIDWSTL